MAISITYQEILLEMASLYRERERLQGLLRERLQQFARPERRTPYDGREQTSAELNDEITELRGML